MNPRPFARVASLAALAFALSACSAASVGVSPSDTGPSTSDDDAGKRRAPEAVGTVDSVAVEGDTVSVVFVADAGYEYFAGTTFVFTAEDGSNGIDGVTLDPGDLAAGDHIRVWVGACAESFPVQCPTEHVDRIEP